MTPIEQQQISDLQEEKAFAEDEFRENLNAEIEKSKAFEADIEQLRKNAEIKKQYAKEKSTENLEKEECLKKELEEEKVKVQSLLDEIESLKIQNDASVSFNS